MAISPAENGFRPVGTAPIRGETPPGPDPPNYSDIMVGELREPGNWMVANIQTEAFWPTNSQKITYKGEAVWILPLMNGYFPTIVMKVPQGKTLQDCQYFLARFVSMLSWVERQGYMIQGFTGGSLPMPMARNKTRGFALQNDFELSYFPEPDDKRALLALALMREGRGLGHPAYSFLSYYRVLEVAIPDGKAWASGSPTTLRPSGTISAYRQWNGLGPPG